MWVYRNPKGVNYVGQSFKMVCKELGIKMIENIKCSVVVLLNNDVWAVWELPGKPDIGEQRMIRRAVSDSYVNCDGATDQRFKVQFIETIPADNVQELIAGLKESIENEIGYG